MRRLALLVLLVACGPPKWKAPATAPVSVVSTKASEYFLGPWPDNRRLKEGKLPTSSFPNPGEGSLALNLFKTSDRLVDGFGLSAPMYVHFGAAIDPATVTDTSVYVVAIDPKSKEYGKKALIEWQYFADATPYLPASTLAIRPIIGAPLVEGTEYAIVVTTDVKDSNGVAIGADESMWNALWDPKHEDAAHYAKLVAYVEKEKIKREAVALGVVFRTQTILRELLSLRDYLQSLPAPTIDNITLYRTRTDAYVFHADYAAPYLIQGDAPYQLEGGQILYNDDGTPKVKEIQRMRLSIVVPRSPMPAAGFPVVMYSHGTGGDYDSVIGDIGYVLASEGIASVGIDQVLHGPRVPANSTCFTESADICFFNPVNAVAGRNLVRQAALDHVTLKKLLETATMPALAHPNGVAVKFDPDHVGYFGHSQGGLSGALYIAIEHDLQAVVISGTGGHLLTTVLLRKDPIDLRALAEGPLFLNLMGNDMIGPFHPTMAFLQTMGEAADPLNYARQWLYADDGALDNIYMTSGLEDPYTPAVGAQALAALVGLPQWTEGATDSPAHALYGLAKVTGPLTANLTTPSGKVTGVFRQFPMEGHFPVFDTPAIQQWREFYITAFASGEATIP